MKIRIHHHHFILLVLCASLWTMVVNAQSIGQAGNSDAQVYFVFNYNEGSPYHSASGDSVPIDWERRIVGPRVFTLPGCLNRVTHVHNIQSSFCGIARPWDDHGHAYDPCSAGSKVMPCDFVTNNGALDTAFIISQAELSASTHAYYRFPQDVIDGQVNHIMIDYEWFVPHDSLWGWHYQTQSKFATPNLADKYQYSITDSLGVTREHYNAIYRIYWDHFIQKLKSIDSNYRIGFYAMPAMNRIQTGKWGIVRYKAPGTIMPDTVFNHIMDHYLGLDDVDVIFHQNYVNLRPGIGFGGSLEKVAPFTAENAVSNELKFHSDARTSAKPFAVGFWLPHWRWDSLYTTKMERFEEALDSLASNGINKVWLSSGTWQRDGDSTELLIQLDSAGVPLDSFLSDLSDAFKRTIFKNLTCTELGQSQKRAGDEDCLLPECAKLHLSIYPNPTNNRATIEWTAEVDGHTRLEIYNSMGARVEVLFDGHKTAGRHTIAFYSESLEPGIYFCRLQCAGSYLLRKLIVTR